MTTMHHYLHSTSGHLYLFEPMKNLIFGMPILPRTKGGRCPPATANLQFIEVLCMLIYNLRQMFSPCVSVPQVTHNP